MEDEYPICTPGAPVSVPRMTDEEIRDGVVAAVAVVLTGCECGGRFERVDDIVVDTVVDGAREKIKYRIRTSGASGSWTRDTGLIAVSSNFTADSGDKTPGFFDSVRIQWHGDFIGRIGSAPRAFERQWFRVLASSQSFGYHPSHEKIFRSCWNCDCFVIAHT